MMKHGGIPTEDSYGPYLGQDGYCHLDRAKMALKIKGWVNVTSGKLNRNVLLSTTKKGLSKPKWCKCKKYYLLL